MTQPSITTPSPLILIVEDDLSTGEVLTLAIAQETNYCSLLATTGQEALSFVRQNRPDLIILDYRLPDTTGIALYDQFQRDQDLRTVPVLLMSATKRTAEIEPRDVTRLDKPFELDEFLTIIDRLITTSPRPCAFINKLGNKLG